MALYRVMQIPYLYKERLQLSHILPVPASSIDDALARQFRTGEPKPAYAFSMEIGNRPLPGVPGVPGVDPESDGSFRPTNPTKYRKIEREAHAALAALLCGALGPASTTPGRLKKK